MTHPVLLDTPTAANAALAAWRASYHVVSPVTAFVTAFHPSMVLSASVVELSPDVDARGRGLDTYCDDAIMAPHERAIAKGGLLKLCRAAGVWWTERTGRRDTRAHPYVWEYYAEGQIRTVEDEPLLLTGTVEVDLRDGSAQIGGWTPEAWATLVRTKRKKAGLTINGWTEQRVLEARAMGLRHAETKAKLSAIRGGLGLQSTYTVAELARPFLVVRATGTPDARTARADAATAVRQLYAPELGTAAPSSDGEV